MVKHLDRGLDLDLDLSIAQLHEKCTGKMSIGVEAMFITLSVEQCPLTSNAGEMNLLRFQIGAKP